MEFGRLLDLYLQILHQNLYCCCSVHWDSLQGWCDPAYEGWWIPCPPRLPGCGWAPGFVVEQGITYLVSGSNKMFLLFEDGLFNFVWFTCMYVCACIYSTYMHPPLPLYFLVCVSFSIHIIQRVCLNLRRCLCCIIHCFCTIETILTILKCLPEYHLGVWSIWL